MKKIIIGLACLLMALVGIALVGQLFAQPREIQITPAYHDVDPAIAALSGVWDASPPHRLVTRVVVEKVRPKWATVLIFWSDRFGGGPYANWQRVKARVLATGDLQWGYPLLYTQRIQNGSPVMEIEKEVLGEFKYATFARVPLNRSADYAMANTPAVESASR